MKKSFLIIAILALALPVFSDSSMQNKEKANLLCRKWRKLSVGLSPDKVEKIIGEPKLSFATSEYVSLFLSASL